jgi:hypothetical protein
MPNHNSLPAKDNYDPRWFIWTIVFLLVTGISLVSYIMLSDTSSANDGSPVTVPNHSVHKK